jgi:hypothetical protein
MDTYVDIILLMIQSKPSIKNGVVAKKKTKGSTV